MPISCDWTALDAQCAAAEARKATLVSEATDARERTGAIPPLLEEAREAAEEARRVIGEADGVLGEQCLAVRTRNRGLARALALARVKLSVLRILLVATRAIVFLWHVTAAAARAAYAGARRAGVGASRFARDCRARIASVARQLWR